MSSRRRKTQEPFTGFWPEFYTAIEAQFEAHLRRRMNIELNFPPNFEGLVLGCIDADFCK